MKRLSVAAVLVAGLALAGPEAQAQTGAARGRVIDEKGEGVADVAVAIEYQGGVTRKFETKTSKKGEFTQVGLQPGGYRFTFTKKGFAPTYIEARVKLGDPTYLPEVTLVAAAKAQAAAAAEALGQLQEEFDKAIQLTQSGQLDQAEAAFQELAVKHPTVPEIQYNLGFVFGQKKDWARAEAAYKKALELKANYSEATVALGRLYQDSGQADKALELMSAGGDDPKVQFSLGVMQFNAGQMEEAYATFQKVQALDPAHADAHYFMGTVALNLGKTDEAVAQLQKYLTMNPQNAQFKQTAEGLVAALAPKK